METCGTGRVARVFGERAEVVVERQEACSSCQAADLCSAFAGRGLLRLEADNPLAAREGQRVEVATARAVGLKAAFVVYMLPALFFVAGVVVGSEALAWPAWGSGLLGLGMLVISWFIAWRYDRRASTLREFRITITRILPAPASGSPSPEGRAAVTGEGAPRAR